MVETYGCLLWRSPRFHWGQAKSSSFRISARTPRGYIRWVADEAHILLRFFEKLLMDGFKFLPIKMRFPHRFCSLRDTFVFVRWSSIGEQGYMRNFRKFKRQHCATKKIGVALRLIEIELHAEICDDEWADLPLRLTMGVYIAAQSYRDWLDLQPQRSVESGVQ